MAPRLGKMRSNELPMLSTDLVQDNVPALVVDRIFVGSIHAAFNQEVMHERGITHVLNASGLPATFPRRFTYLGVDIRDTEKANILSAIAATNMFIEAGLEKGRVLVHCLGGHSRSPTFVMAYLMSTSGYSFDQAYEILRRARPVASINRGFEYQLRAYSATGCDTNAAHQLVLRLRLAAIKPSPLALRSGGGRSPTEENRVGGEEGNGNNIVDGDDRGLVGDGCDRVGSGLFHSLSAVSAPPLAAGRGGNEGGTMEQQQGKMNNNSAGSQRNPIGQYLQLNTASCRLRFSSPNGPSMQVMSPLSSLETIFDCEACGTLLFAGTSIMSTEISLPDVSTVLSKRTATPTSAQCKESLLNSNFHHADIRHNIPMEVETPGLDDQSECSSVDTSTSNAQRWDMVDFGGRRVRSNHSCSGVQDSAKSFHFSPTNCWDTADSLQSSRHSSTTAASGAMDCERASVTSTNSPLKLECGLMPDQPSVGMPYLKLMVGVAMGNSPMATTIPLTPNNPVRSRVVSSKHSFYSNDSPDHSERSLSTMSGPQPRPQSAEKRRWLAQMAMEGHGAIVTPHQKELDLLHLTTQDGKWILVEPLQWMGDIRGELSGKICCPNPSCCCVLGEWSWLPGKLGPPCIPSPTIGLLETAIRMTRYTLSQFDRKTGMLKKKDSPGKKPRYNTLLATAQLGNGGDADVQIGSSGTTPHRRQHEAQQHQ